MGKKQQQIRELKFRLKQANKLMGQQGDTIYRQRCQIAELRALTSKDERQAMREWLDGDERQHLVARISSREIVIQRLREQLRAQTHMQLMQGPALRGTLPCSITDVSGSLCDTPDLNDGDFIRTHLDLK